MTRKPNLNIETGNLFLKHQMFRHTISGSIDFIQRSWKVGATGLKERSPVPGFASDEKIYPFQQLVIQPSEIKILKELGTGGSSTVHLISYRDSQFALKIINMDDEKHQFKSAQSEIETLRALQSKYVVNMKQAFIRNRRIAIILEYMNASSLYVAYQKCNNQTQRSTLSRSSSQQFSQPLSQPLSHFNHSLNSLSRSSSQYFSPYQQTGQLSSQQARGITNMEVLASITSHILICMLDMKNFNICHRDIKPSNIMLHSFSSNDGVAKVTDFGLAKILKENELCAETVGTYKYHSPERIQYLSYDASSDVWSLGVTIAEAFLGRYPFNYQLEKCDDDDEFRLFLCQDPLNDQGFPSHLFPTELLQFITCCMRMNPQERPTVEELLQFPFLSHARTEEYSRIVIGKWIEQSKLEMPKSSEPVQIHKSSARGRRMSVAQQFFSVTLDPTPVVSMSLESSGMGSSVMSHQFQPNFTDDNMSITGSLTNFGYEDPCIEDSITNQTGDFHISPKSYNDDHLGFHIDDGDHYLHKDEMEVFGFSFE